MGNKNHKGFTGIAGEYFTAAEISKRGGIATITLKNTPDIDILASSADGKKTVSIQVKAGRLTTGGFIVGREKMRSFGRSSFYVFVSLKEGAEKGYWIIPQSVVARITESDYQRWIKGRPARSKRAPRTFQWKHLKSRRFQKYHDNWGVLGLW
ncbi:hypothetical protein COU12_01165 [Candidatus Jorgensenbacteria bacterium CG10_big_fil_rev_8_21_14_0_10_54_38]|uniref:PD(D/E)XK endonuclease domain-containing protein n=2 Tax=Candidatus Joergenseniibacteriota TaxID=1752739 RepID=A0A2M6WGA6_9BACT|nr:MAG: hypothetical protein COX26_02610 [Candidatus Jorgensenbacteria bacterium CG23_combo_of_CG06-09_8_20_14_all_54_14]PIT91809.1 MAG: hypothetical protein COU12_01165 [Candidatus Jorgensenbacteria bacterium CG10_big_fil_rev_8_21_14_0_10_54_38]